MVGVEVLGKPMHFQQAVEEGKQLPGGEVVGPHWALFFGLEYINGAKLFIYETIFS